MKNIGYVIRLHGVTASYAYGMDFRHARVFSTLANTRENVKTFRGIGSRTKPDQILRVELTKGGRPKKKNNKDSKMTKLEALKSAKEKANLSKQNQVVFQYVKDIEVLFDYTHETLWDRRHFYPPITTKVAVVTPDTTNGKKRKNSAIKIEKRGKNGENCR